MAAVKPFLPLQYRALSQRDWGRILFVKPLAFVEALDDLIISLLTFCEEYSCIGNREQQGNFMMREKGRERGDVQGISKELSIESVSVQSEAEREKTNSQRLQEASRINSMKANGTDDGEEKGKGKGEKEREEEGNIAASRNIDRLRLLKSLSLLADSLKWHDSNRHRWGNNLHARRCSKSIEILAAFCSIFLGCYKQFTDKESSETKSVELSQDDSSRDHSRVAEDFLDNLSTNKRVYSGNLEKLRIEYENTELMLTEFFDRPKFYYACNLSIKTIENYPGCSFVPSQSIPICSALNMIPPIIDDKNEFHPAQVRNDMRNRGSLTPLKNNSGDENYFNDWNSQNYIPVSMMMNTGSQFDFKTAEDANLTKNTGYSSVSYNYSKSNSNICSRGRTDQHGLAYQRMKKRSLHRPNLSVGKIKTVGGTSCNAEILLNPESSSRSARRSCKYWWWDAAAACDWPLLCQLIPQAALHEEDRGFSDLLLTCMKNGAGLEIVREFIRYVHYI